MNQVQKITNQQKRKMAVRKKLHGTAQRPRLSVFRSNRYIYLQLINDDTGESLFGATDAAKEETFKGTKTEKSAKVAKELVKEMKKKKIKQIVFDRGPYKYHGRVKMVAETLRKEGIEF
jgi:large subunit ribosomal protein L18